MDALEIVLLYDYYGDLLTDRQKECFELRYNEDLSLGEIGEELGISRQGVYDNLNRTEQLLRNMEQKTGCVRRDIACRKTMQLILALANDLADHQDERVSVAAKQIVSAAQGLEE